MRRITRRTTGIILDIMMWIDHISSKRIQLIFEPTRMIHGNSIAVIASFIPSRFQHVERYKKELEDCGFSVVTILNIQDVKSIQLKDPNYDFYRHNLGFDLGMYRDVLRKIDKASFDDLELIFLNDSMYYGDATLTEIIKRMRNQKSQRIYTVTSSEQHKHHLQSYLIYASVNSINLKKLQEVFEKFRNWRFKRSAVTYGEKAIKKNADKVGLIAEGLWNTQILQGLPKNECCECQKYAEVKPNRVNPTEHLIHKLELYEMELRKFGRSAIQNKTE